MYRFQPGGLVTVAYVHLPIGECPKYYPRELCVVLNNGRHSLLACLWKFQETSSNLLDLPGIEKEYIK